jgi:hypothetical protein
MAEATVATQAISSTQIHAIEDAKQKHKTRFGKPSFWFLWFAEYFAVRQRPRIQKQIGVGSR